MIRLDSLGMTKTEDGTLVVEASDMQWRVFPDQVLLDGVLCAAHRWRYSEDEEHELKAVDYRSPNGVYRLTVFND